MSDPKQEACDRAAVVVARMGHWVPEEKRSEFAAHIRIALDTEVEAGGPYLNNGWNKRTPSPPEPTEGQTDVLAPFRGLHDATWNDLFDAIKEGSSAAFSQTWIRKLSGLRDAAASHAMPLQDHASDSLSQCEHPDCRTWRSKPCGEGCYWETKHMVSCLRSGDDKLSLDAANEIERMSAALEYALGGLRAVAAEAKAKNLTSIYGVAQGALDLAERGETACAEMRGDALIAEQETK